MLSFGVGSDQDRRRAADGPWQESDRSGHRSADRSTERSAECRQMPLSSGRADGRESLCDRLVPEGLKVRQAVHTSSSQVYERETPGQGTSPESIGWLNRHSTPNIPQISRTGSCVASVRRRRHHVTAGIDDRVNWGADAEAAAGLSDRRFARGRPVGGAGKPPRVCPGSRRPSSASSDPRPR
jgi:hypothetical protein